MQLLLTVLILVLAPFQFFISRLHELTGIGRSVGDMSTDAPVLATPAPYAFFIWILIFTLWTLAAIHQALPSQRTSKLWPRLRVPMVITLAAGNFWMLTAIMYGNGWPLLALITVMTIATYIALGRAVASLTTDVLASPPYRRILLPALAIMAGWLTLALFLNLCGVLQLAFGLPTGGTFGSVALLISATLAGYMLLGSLRPSPIARQYYGLTLIWGLLGTAIANSHPTHSVLHSSSAPVAVTAIGLAIIVLAILCKPVPRK